MQLTHIIDEKIELLETFFLFQGDILRTVKECLLNDKP